MFIDANLLFDPAGTAITAGGASTNVIDLGANRDIGVGTYRGRLNTLISTTLTAAAQTATLNIQVQGAPDNGNGIPGGYTTLVETGALPIGLLVAGARVANFDIAAVANTLAQQSAAGATATFSSGVASITVSSATGIKAGQYVNGAGITPGTIVSSAYVAGSTTVPLSQVTTAAGAATAVSFTVAIPPPRFLRVNYVVANGPFTGGQLISFITADPADELSFYQPGFTQPY